MAQVYRWETVDMGVASADHTANQHLSSPADPAQLGSTVSLPQPWLHSRDTGGPTVTSSYTPASEEKQSLHACDGIAVGRGLPPLKKKKLCQWFEVTAKKNLKDMPNKSVFKDKCCMWGIVVLGVVRLVEWTGSSVCFLCE